MNRVLIVLFAIAFLAMAGCQPAEPQTRGGMAFIGGTQGLAISFVDSMPPPEIFDAAQSVFSVGVYLQNVGEAPISQSSLRNRYGYVEIIGISPQQFGKGSQQDLKVTFAEANINLEGSRRGFQGEIIAGEIDIISIDDLTYLPDRVGNQEVTVRANVCYEYATFTNTDICIKDDIIENVFDDTICTLSGAKPVSNSGAPIQVTHLTQSPGSRETIVVTFTVANVGRGVPFLPWDAQGAPADACRQTFGHNPARNTVYAEVTVGGDSSLYNIRCPLLGGSNAGNIPMWQGSEATLTCTITPVNTGGSRIFTDSLQIDMWYTYFEAIERPLLIRDANMGTGSRVDGSI